MRGNENYAQGRGGELQGTCDRMIDIPDLSKKMIDIPVLLGGLLAKLTCVQANGRMDADRLTPGLKISSSVSPDKHGMRNHLRSLRPACSVIRTCRVELSW